jgi:superfamily II DNA or RNA helicase
MLKDCDWSIDRDYKTGSENEPMQFYLEGLSNSAKFDLLLGYFSSAAINLLSVGFASFIKNGGNMRLVINHMLSSKDKEVLSRVEENPNGVKVFDLTDARKLTEVLNEYDIHFFECLAYLIVKKRIEIKVIKPKNGNGIAHYKAGVFSDGVDSIGYQASCNFTYYGLSENIEQLQAFLSWENGRSNKFIKKQLNLIDNYFLEKDEDVDYLSSNQIEAVIRNKFGEKDINELLVQEELLLNKKKSLFNNFKISKVISRIAGEIENFHRTPRFPFSEGARDYQVNAYSNWVQNSYRGIFAMATGTGKTITSLNCVLENYKRVGYYQALILVPTISLVEQWNLECQKFNFKENVIKVYSLNNWQEELSRLETLKILGQKFSFIVIATYSSFISKSFQLNFKALNAETILIADECHNLGSNRVLSTLDSFHLEKRIGLSATPERQYQEDINNKIRVFFGERSDSDYTFSYSMYQAIKVMPRALCPYKYYPKLVRLTNSEFEKYVSYTKRIVSFRPSNDEEREIFNRLCIARQRIIHKAENKLTVFKSILQDEYAKRKSLKYTLIYVAEGLAEGEAEFNPSKSDILNETDADINLLNTFTKVIGELFSDVSVRQFTGRTSSDERREILKSFSQGNLQVITSMKCLDEGIDVPRSELAIFCSSTGNPRQFIQRRGRVLRLAEGKDEAVIYDLVVIPEPTGDPALFKTEQSEIERELRRVRDFAEMSENKYYTRQLLEPILNKYKLIL